MVDRASMIPSWTRDLTWYFTYLLFISTIGPLLFGFHLVSICGIPHSLIQLTVASPG